MSVEKFLPREARGQLWKLAEEAIELALACAKAGRFGFGNRWPPETGPTNADNIASEFNDVRDAFAAIEGALEPYRERPPAATPPAEKETLDELLARRHREVAEAQEHGQTFYPTTPAPSRVAGPPHGVGDPGFGNPAKGESS